jgi:hypothetical protein
VAISVLDVIYHADSRRVSASLLCVPSRSTVINAGGRIAGGESKHSSRQLLWPPDTMVNLKPSEIVLDESHRLLNISQALSQELLAG